jgi:L-asparagine transporter-like permease
MIKIWKYIGIRYLITFILFFAFIHKEWRFEGWDTLRDSLDSFEDWFMFFWLFILPVLFELLYQGLAMSYFLKKLSRQNWLLMFFTFVLLFSLEFIVTIQFFAIHFVTTKLIVSVVLFFVFYGNYIMLQTRLNSSQNSQPPS